MLQDPIARRLAPAAVAILAFIWLSLVSPWLDIHQIDVDEGLNLGKASLVAAGFAPYQDIWNDQGPVLTYVLAALQSVAPNNVVAARLVVVGAASLLLAGLFALVRRENGTLAAFGAVVLLGTTAYFIRLASAVMIGLPAIALAVLALAVCAPGPRPSGKALLSGVLFGLSLQTKLFTFTIAPAMLMTVAGTATGRKALRLAALAIGAALVTFAFVAVVSGENPIDRLVQTHLASELRRQYAFSRSLGTIWETLTTMPAILVPGLLGLFTLVLPGGERRAVVPAVWLVTAFVALGLHHPVQPHQILLLAVPLAWLGGVFVATGASIVTEMTGRHRYRIPLVAVAIAGLAVLGMSTLPERQVVARRQAAALSSDAVATYAPFGGWVIVDQPMAAFRNGLLVPP